MNYSRILKLAKKDLSFRKQILKTAKRSQTRFELPVKVKLNIVTPLEKDPKAYRIEGTLDLGKGSNGVHIKFNGLYDSSVKALAKFNIFGWGGKPSLRETFFYSGLVSNAMKGYLKG